MGLWTSVFGSRQEKALQRQQRAAAGSRNSGIIQLGDRSAISSNMALVPYDANFAKQQAVLGSNKPVNAIASAGRSFGKWAGTLGGTKSLKQIGSKLAAGNFKGAMRPAMNWLAAGNMAGQGLLRAGAIAGRVGAALAVADFLNPFSPGWND